MQVHYIANEICVYCFEISGSSNLTLLDMATKRKPDDESLVGDSKKIKASSSSSSSSTSSSSSSQSTVEALSESKADANVQTHQALCEDAEAVESKELDGGENAESDHDDPGAYGDIQGPSDVSGLFPWPHTYADLMLEHKDDGDHACRNFHVLQGKHISHHEAFAGSGAAGVSLEMCCDALNMRISQKDGYSSEPVSVTTTTSCDINKNCQKALIHLTQDWVMTNKCKMVPKGFVALESLCVFFLAHRSSDQIMFKEH